MGRLIYGDSVRVHFDDHTLAHLEAVIGTKLRRGEPFMLMWRDDTAVGDGRSTVWINPGNKIAFQYFSRQRPPLDRHRLEAPVIEARRPDGLYLPRDAETA